MSAFGPPVAGLRTIRIVLVLVAFGVMVNTGGMVVSFFLNADRVDQINQERTRNTTAACVHEAGQNNQILLFLEARGATKPTLDEARRFFPVKTREECAAQSRQQVSNP